MPIRFSRFPAIIMLLAAAACDLTSDPLGADAPAADHEVAAQFDARADVLRDHMRYIVVLNDDVANVVDAVNALREHNIDSLHHVFRYGVKGFSAHLTEGAVERLREHPGVASVSRDRLITDAAWPGTVRNNVGWGLGRIDQRSNNSSYTYLSYSDGAGVNIYAVDSGVDAAHPEFGGRVQPAFTFNSSYPAGEDCNGHGTSVASVAAGATIGVASGATVHDVRTRNCGGMVWLGDRIAGVDWVTGNRQHPAVMNLSMGLPTFWDGVLPGSLSAAVVHAMNAGVVVVVSAGNDNSDACGQAPAELSSAIVVASTSASGARSTFSNFGNCIDFFAPGSGVAVALHGGGFGTKSGTSFAAPYAAGTAALVMQRNIGAYSLGLVKHVLSSSATYGVVSNPGLGSPNRVLYSLHTYVQVIGDTHVTSPGNYTWSARPFGGNGTYAISWSVSTDSGWSFTPVGGGPSYTRYVSESKNGLVIKATMVSDGETVTTEIPVYVCMDGGIGFCGV